MAIPYVKQVWADNDATKPVSAARLGYIESGVLDAHFMPAVHVTHNVGQSTTSGLGAVLAFNTERYDQASGVADTMHDTAVNNSRLTCRYAGIYRITGRIAFAANATGVRTIDLRLNGATVIARHAASNATASFETTVGVDTDWALAVNDYVELVAAQNSGGALDVSSAASYSPEFSMVRVG